VARAKRTDRAEARRRYRATNVDEPTANEEEEGSPSAEAPSRTRPGGRERVAAASAPASPPPRPSITRAFSSSFRPVDLRGDIAALPLLLRHRAFLIPLALIVAATVALIVTGGSEPITLTLSQYLLFPPPVAAVFLAGFLAPRASWLLGALLGIAATIGLEAFLASPGIQAVAAAAANAGGQPVSPIVLFTYAIVGGALFAAIAAWYKRFLFLANPQRAARQASRASDRQRKRGSENRPLLARRR
jgi:hypothetical protein